MRGTPTAHIFFVDANRCMGTTSLDLKTEGGMKNHDQGIRVLRVHAALPNSGREGYDAYIIPCGLPKNLLSVVARLSALLARSRFPQTHVVRESLHYDLGKGSSQVLWKYQGIGYV